MAVEFTIHRTDIVEVSTQKLTVREDGRDFWITTLRVTSTKGETADIVLFTDGGPLSLAEGTYRPTPATAAPTNCRHCGERVREDSGVCPGCGAADWTL